ncbi:4Fe-4S dicluster domain-containing protein [Clostridium formicaceticum]|uniref:Electron transport complex protein RnfC n=1 Tax=Clostridium formicaceticum TaxID=1497 RepID=A0AAC9RME3_9CLOT|nr:4Fe-4S dicluster domain-containing protein [Clostridium formicaceticum]AOY77123.1 NADH dehydrogenase [Clostridium formicaceticum]ARE87638.1 Electron transport complex protein RnfC [Clostridium formicaceticum]
MTDRWIDKIKESGIVGAGGAGFPTHIKLSATAEYIIVNAAECEPLIKVDQQLLEHYTEEIAEALNIVLQKTEAKKAFIAIKRKHMEVIKKINQVLSKYDKIEVFELDDIYPAGDEQVTVYEVLKKVVPQGGIPFNVGCIVCNVETVLNVFHAMKGYPVIYKYVTVTGEVPNPFTYKLPIGISYREVLKICGVENLEGKVAIDGGPMMGNIVADFDKPITKTTKAIILLDKDHTLIKKKSMTIKQTVKQSKIACIQCTRCTALCPRSLLGHDVKPHIIMRTINYGLSNMEGFKTAVGCSECGACELYACPNGLSPRKVNGMIKQEFMKAGIKVDHKGKIYEASPYREYRSIPVKRLVQRLGIKQYDLASPLIENQYAPKKVVLPLKQHVGAPATAIVEEGSSVKAGDLIAKIAEDKLGANIHASISGIITQVASDAITIEVEE